MLRTLLRGLGLTLSGIALLFCGILLLAGLAMIIASIAENCTGSSTTFNFDGEVVEHQKYGCERHPQYVPWGLLIIAGGALSGWGVATAEERPILGTLVTILGALPGLPLIAVTTMGLAPFIVIPVGLPGIALRLLANVGLKPMPAPS
jgi:protein-S-isoprenylcysteine O-methyltransferase Ste14